MYICSSRDLATLYMSVRRSTCASDFLRGNSLNVFACKDCAMCCLILSCSHLALAGSCHSGNSRYHVFVFFYRVYCIVLFNLLYIYIYIFPAPILLNCIVYVLLLFYFQKKNVLTLLRYITLPYTIRIMNVFST